MRLSRLFRTLAVATMAFAIACSANTSGGGNGVSSGGTPGGRGGTTAKGGSDGSGGVTGSGGQVSGGVNNAGGKTGSGGASGGGVTGSGGLGSGGANNTAGKSGSGGASGGGATGSGGMGSGGASGTAGTTGSGGATGDAGVGGSGGKGGSGGTTGPLDAAAGGQCGPSTVAEPFSTSIAGTWDFTPAGGSKADASGSWRRLAQARHHCSERHLRHADHGPRFRCRADHADRIRRGQFPGDAVGRRQGSRNQHDLVHPIRLRRHQVRDARQAACDLRARQGRPGDEEQQRQVDRSHRGRLVAQRRARDLPLGHCCACIPMSTSATHSCGRASPTTR